MSTKSSMTQKSLANLAAITGGPLSLSKLLWAIRMSEALTQVAFAKLLGISKQHLCDIEHNRKTISAKRAANYADKLGYSQKQFVRLALQDELDRAGLAFEVEIRSVA